MRLKKRPLKITRKEHIDPKTLEGNMRHFEEQLLTLDDRRIAQQTAVAEGADDAATIQNILASVNAFYVLMNTSDLTQE